MLELFFISIILLIVFYKTGMLKGAWEEGKTEKRYRRRKASFETVIMIVSLPFIILFLSILSFFADKDIEKNKRIREEAKGTYFIENIDNYEGPLILNSNNLCYLYSYQGKASCNWNVKRNKIIINGIVNDKSFTLEAKPVENGIMINNQFIQKDK